MENKTGKEVHCRYLERATEDGERKTYSIKPQDFTPFIGPFIYQHRNWKEAKAENKIPNDSYYSTGNKLLMLDFATGIAIGYAILQGLEALIK